MKISKIIVIADPLRHRLGQDGNADMFFGLLHGILNRICDLPVELLKPNELINMQKEVYSAYNLYFDPLKVESSIFGGVPVDCWMQICFAEPNSKMLELTQKYFKDALVICREPSYIIKKSLLSLNIPFVEMMQEIKPKTAISYLKKMGITTLTENDESLALALGGLDKGITPLEMAAAYATIANDGKYIEPTFYTTITNKSGKTVVKAKAKTKRVVSKQVAYIIKEILTQPVKGNNGTATYCAISGIDVAAKTGTTDENYDRWLCGFTPYYTAVTWFGYDQNETIYFNKQNPAGIIWANVMRRVHSGLANATFEKPSWIQTATICADSGKVANSGCTNTYEEYFLFGTKPGNCTEHSGGKITTNSNNNQNVTNQNVFNNELTLDPSLETETPSTNSNSSTNNTRNTVNNSYSNNTTNTNSSTNNIRNNTTGTNTNVHNNTNSSGTNSSVNNETTRPSTNTTTNSSSNTSTSSGNEDEEVE